MIRSSHLPLARALPPLLACAVGVGACAPRPAATPPEARRLSRPAPREAATLANRFAKRCTACAAAIWRAARGRAATPVALKSASLRARAETTWRRGVARCLTGEGYGGTSVLPTATVRAWLAQRDCAGFAKAVFTAQTCLALQATTAEAYRTWWRMAHRGPAALPPAKKRRRATTRRARAMKRAVDRMGTLRILGTGRPPGSISNALKSGRIGVSLGGRRGGSRGSGRINAGFGGFGRGGGGGGGGGALVGARLRTRRGRAKRPRTPRPGVHLVTFTTPAGIGRLTVKRRLTRLARLLRTCYAQGLRRHPTLRGRVTYRFQVAATGRVSYARIRHSSRPLGRTARCGLARLRRARFPAPRGRSRPLITATFAFAPR